MFQQKAVPSGGSNLARLGELGGNQIRSTVLVYEIHLKLVRKIVSVKKIQAEALP